MGDTAGGGRVILWLAAALRLWCACCQFCDGNPGASDALQKDAYLDFGASSLIQRQAAVHPSKGEFLAQVHKEHKEEREDAGVPPQYFHAPAPAIESSLQQERKALAVPDGGVCITPETLAAALTQASQEVLRGLPPWPRAFSPDKLSSRSHAPVRLAFLVQVSVKERLPLVRRVFSKLYSSGDIFLYLVDTTKLAASDVQDALGLTAKPLSNVVVQESPHAGYFYWPRVQVVLDGLASLLDDDWDFVIHLSETDYPVHSLAWLHSNLGVQRSTNFIAVEPRCSRPKEAMSFAAQASWEVSDRATKKDVTHEDATKKDGTHEDALQTVESDWYWWGASDGVASCGSKFDPMQVSGATYPQRDLERHGFIFAKGPEWVVLTRQLAAYALMPELLQFRRLIGMHAAADELFWSTLVLNIPNFTQSLSQQGWYLHWKTGSTDHSPDLLSAVDATEILAQKSGLLFVRKVSEVESAALLDKLDQASLAERTSLAVLQSQVHSWTLHLDRSAMRCSETSLLHAPAPASPPFNAPAPPALSSLA